MSPREKGFSRVKFRLMLVGALALGTVWLIVGGTDKHKTLTVCSTASKVVKGKTRLSVDSSIGGFVVEDPDVIAILNGKKGVAFDVTYDGTIEQIISAAAPAAIPEAAPPCKPTKP